MKNRATLTTLSFIIGIISIIVSITTGFLGAKLASYTALGFFGLTWVAWVTIHILQLDRILYSKQPISDTKIIQKRISYNPQHEFLIDESLLINSPKRMIKIPGDFLSWPSFTIIFWANITEQYFNSSYDRYLFFYNTEKYEKSNYRNAFFLRTKGDSLDWSCFVIGYNRKDPIEIKFSTSWILKGWKFFTIRKSNGTDLIFEIDAGKTFFDKRAIPSGQWPQSKSNFLFHLGGMESSNQSGLSLLEFRGFRIYNTCLGDDDLKTLYAKESELLIPNR
ncbi:MAG: hypothetical protein ABIK15_10655 [Pseudomonadota bacterium]